MSKQHMLWFGKCIWNKWNTDMHMQRFGINALMCACTFIYIFFLINTKRYWCTDIQFFFFKDVHVYTKSCQSCGGTFHYREHVHGVHNFNRKTMLSLRLCKLFRSALMVRQLQLIWSIMKRKWCFIWFSGNGEGPLIKLQRSESNILLYVYHARNADQAVFIECKGIHHMSDYHCRYIL